ncbi:transcriptional regulator [Corynebacterium sp. sy017]|uniref:winged helix-turn-helix transcriptional regulator n=1 Tax=unclassified Corynebacterium TaxID=2624378 RepID=UPI001184DCB8|nr:helix-turn-helix domain-containing protein [Corynebacterium sp. SY003]MBP3088377.1 transcriptional regulator [Corynebacterium sp. sy017]TSD91693.1 transcriptional regulator [Corynebacterium sp. SY003]
MLDRVSDKWTALIIGKLSQHPLRFNQLKRDVQGISAKILTQTLRSLERDGMITRTVYPTMPVGVEYELTELGRSLALPLAAIRQWAEEHRDDVLAANEKYDAQAPTPSPASINASHNYSSEN